jgi:serine/threonine-protein kinase HipA
MSSRRRELLASINGREVGALRDEGSVWSFEYIEEWRRAPDAFDLAPDLPRGTGRTTDEASRRPVQWFFDNLLPEESARDLLAREAQVPSADAFGLLAYFGRESAGALTLLAPGEARAGAGYQALTDTELHERISRLPHRALSSGAPKRMSLAGGQHKLAVAVRQGGLFHPVGDSPSTHILKPDHKQTDHYPNSVANEYFVMRLAERVGLRVPSVEMRFVPDPVYLIERFDRRPAQPEPLRLHAIDACQLLGLGREFKYQQSSVESLVRCVALCQNRAQARQGILAWAMFNVLVGNGDAHLKNLSFLVRAEGIDLAPFYDLLSTECYRAEDGNHPRWPAVPLPMRMGDAETFGAVRRRDLIAFAEELGSTARVATRILDDYCASLPAEAAALYHDLEQREFPAPIARASILRTLNSIRFTVMAEMTRRVAAA